MDRLRTQFGLKTLIGLTAIVAVGLAILGSRFYQRYLNHQAITAITEAGGQYRQDKQQQIVRVYLSIPKINDQLLESLIAHLQHLPKLKEIDLVKVSITNESIDRIAKLGQVQQLVLFETKLTEDGIARLKQQRPTLEIMQEEPDPIATMLASRRIYSHAIVALAWSPDGSKLVTGSGDGVLRVWDPASARPLKILQGHADWVFSVAFSPDGTTLASGGGDNLIRLWDTNSWQFIGKLSGHTDDVHCVCFSPDGQTLYSSSDDSTIGVWNVKEKTKSYVMVGHEAQIPNIAISPDGETLASVSRDDSVRLWDAQSGQSLGVLGSHNDDVMAVAFDQTGKWLVTGGHDRRVLLWDVRSKKLCSLLGLHDKDIHCIEFDSERNRVLSGGEDGLRSFDSDSREASRIAPATCNLSNISTSPTNTDLIAVTNSEGEITFIDANSFETRRTLSTTYASRDLN